VSTAPALKKIAVIGGAFDPIHFGHLRLALELQEELLLSEVRFVPLNQAVHKYQPHAGSHHRLAMLKLALIGQQAKNWLADDCEIQRGGPSYMVDTLRELRAEVKEASLLLCLGYDAVCHLDTWKEWRQLLDLAHLVIISRPGYQLPFSGEVAQVLNERKQVKKDRLFAEKAGSVYEFKMTALNISSTKIRHLMESGLSAKYLLPDAVMDYIQAHHLYNRPGEKRPS